MAKFSTRQSKRDFLSSFFFEQDKYQETKQGDYWLVRKFDRVTDFNNWYVEVYSQKEYEAYKAAGHPKNTEDVEPLKKGVVYSYDPN